MKRNILFLLSLCMLLLTCSDGNDPIKEIEKPNVETKDPFITLKKTNIDFINEGGSEAISIESNVSWTAKSSAGWCTVTPSSGNKSTTTITLTAPSNEDYDNRSCTVTLEGEGLTKTITVNQGENLGLLITQDRYELGNEESTIKVEVKANVEFEVEINDKWITKIEKRGLTTTELEFNIAENDTYGNREGSITIKQKDGGMTSTITIFQSQEDAIILSEKDFELTSKAQSVEVELKTNIDYEIIIPENAKDWVSHSTTRALRTETVVLDIAQNKDYDERTAKIVVKDKKTDLEETVTIKQAANTGLIVSTDKYELTNDGGTVEVEVKANVEFDIEISDKWITRIETRGLTETKLQFQVAKNQGYDNREGTITIKQKGGNLSSTIKVYQSQKDAIILSEKEFDLSSEAQAVEVELKTNIDYEIIIPEDAKEWVSHTTTRALRAETVVLDIAENNIEKARSTEVYVKNKSTNLQDTLYISQNVNLFLNVTINKYELSYKENTIEVELNTNVDYEVVVSDNWISSVEFIEVASSNLTFNIAENSSNYKREGTITLKQKEGDLYCKVTVFQFHKGLFQISDCTAGNISTFINNDVKYELEELLISGSLNGTDIQFIREMLGSDVDGNYTQGKLRILDISKCNIVEGGLPYVFSRTVTNNAIGSYMFEGCSSLDELQLPKSITSIEEYAFFNCSNLKSLDVPEGVTDLGVNILQGCTSFNNLTIPGSVKSWSKLGETSVKNITLKNGVEYIPSDAFSYHCKNLETLVIPKSVTFIGNNAFSYGGLKAIYIDNLEQWLNYTNWKNPNYPFDYTGRGWHNDKVDDRDFSKGGKLYVGGKLLTDLSIPDEVQYIPSYAFHGCVSIENISIPNNVTSIRDNAFSGTRIKSITIPNSVTHIGEYAFAGCYNLTSITFSNSVTVVPTGFALDCSSLREVIIPNNVKEINERAFETCDNLESVTLPKILETIKRMTFYLCRNLKKITIPKGVHTIESGAFQYTSLNEVYCLPITPPTLHSIDWGAWVDVFSVDKETAKLFVPKGSLEAYKSSDWGVYFSNILEME